MIGVGAALGAAGGACMAILFPHTAHACTSVGAAASANPDPGFVSRCLEPGMGLMACVVFVIAGGALFLYGVSLAVRSWMQRPRELSLERRLKARVVDRADAVPSAEFFSLSGPGTSGPPPGWYVVPPDYSPMWWDGTSWAPAPPDCPPPGWYPVGGDEPPQWWDGQSWRRRSQARAARAGVGHAD